MIGLIVPLVVQQLSLHYPKAVCFIKHYVLVRAQISIEVVRTRVREHADFKSVRSRYFSRSLILQYHTSDPREGSVNISPNIYHRGLN